MTSPRAEKTSQTFRMTCAVTVNIRADRARIWQLLTDGPAFSTWNSTVKRLGGTIALGQTLELEVPSAPGRTFRPKVTAFESARSMEWSEGMAPMFRGVRTYELQPQPDGTTDFRMHEVFAGIMLPMIRGSLPDFAPIFETYAADLKREAERSGANQR